MPSPISQRFITQLRAMNGDMEIDFIKRDDLGDHYVQWVDKAVNEGIVFYVDEINARIVVEYIGEV